MSGLHDFENRFKIENMHGNFLLTSFVRGGIVEMIDIYKLLIVFLSQ